MTPVDRLGLVPLPCSLDPLPDESLAGFLLRLAHRLQISPIRPARLMGVVRRPTDTTLGRRLLLDLDIDRFAHATRLTEDEATELTLRPWRSRSPPIARSLESRDPRGIRENWLFNDFPRYCPECLAGDGSPVQQQFGGTWKEIWLLPITFICPTHKVFLRHRCRQPHGLQRMLVQLIPQAADHTLRPDQCRFPIALEGQNPTSRKGRKGPSCGARLDRAAAPWPPPGTNMIEAQQQLLGLLSPSHTARAAASYFTDLRVTTAFLCSIWPASRNMIAPVAHEAVADHVRTLRSSTWPTLDRPPIDPIATAGLLVAASALLSTADLDEVLAQHTRAALNGPPAEVAGPKFSSDTGPPVRNVCDRQPHGPHAPTGSTVLKEPEALTPPSATVLKTSPRSWSRSGSTTTSDRWNLAPMRSPCAAAGLSSSSSGQLAAP